MPRVKHLAAALVLLLPGCATHVPMAADLPAREFVGHVTMAENGNWFSPCETSGHARWWVTLTDDAVAQFARAREQGMVVAGEPSFVRWTAALTDDRHVGPGGPALLVRSIAEIRPARTNDCAHP